jgi:hypothetical protein
VLKPLSLGKVEGIEDPIPPMRVIVTACSDKYHISNCEFRIADFGTEKIQDPELQIPYFNPLQPAEKLLFSSLLPRIPWSGLIDKYGVNSSGNPDVVPAKAGIRYFLKTGFPRIKYGAGLSSPE